MAKYHIRDNGDPGRCNAMLRPCPKGENTPHYNSREEARAAYEVMMEDKMLAAMHDDLDADFEIDGNGRDVLDDINTAYSREAGRWCEHCKQSGSHHSDKHDEFVKAAKEYTERKSSARDVEVTRRIMEAIEPYKNDHAKLAEWENSERNSFKMIMSRMIVKYNNGEYTDDEEFANHLNMTAAGERSGLSRRARDASESLIRQRTQDQLNKMYNNELEDFALEPTSSKSPFSVDSRETKESESEAKLKQLKEDLEFVKPFASPYDLRWS